MKIERICQYCKRLFFAKYYEVQNGRAIFCSVKCNAAMASRISLEKRILQSHPCKQCGKPVMRYPSQFAQGRGNFCSKKCHDLFRHEKGSLERRCLTCKRIFSITKDYARKQPGKYCSLKCAHVGLQKRIECVCVICGGIFWMIPARLKIGGGKYCSQRCEYVARSWFNYPRHMCYTPEFLRMVSEPIDEYCNVPGCSIQRSQSKKTKTPWAVCSFHLNRINKALRMRLMRRDTQTARLLQEKGVTA